jgi:hypothetical protein
MAPSVPIIKHDLVCTMSERGITIRVDLKLTLRDPCLAQKTLNKSFISEPQQMKSDPTTRSVSMQYFCVYPVSDRAPTFHPRIKTSMRRCITLLTIHARFLPGVQLVGSTLCSFTHPIPCYHPPDEYLPQEFLRDSSAHIHLRPAPLFEQEYGSYQT